MLLAQGSSAALRQTGHHSGVGHATCHGPFAGLDDPPSPPWVCGMCALPASLAVHQLHPCATAGAWTTSRAASWTAGTTPRRPSFVSSHTAHAVMEELLGVSSFRPSTVTCAGQEPTFFVHWSASLHETAKVLKGMRSLAAPLASSEAGRCLRWWLPHRHSPGNGGRSRILINMQR